MIHDSESLDEDANHEGAEEATSLAEVAVDLDKLLNHLALDSAEGVFGADGKVRVAAGRGVGLRFIGTYFPEAQHDLRIATGYFYLSGYDISRHFIHRETKVHVLVGQAQGRRATQMVVGKMVSVVEEVMSELGTTRFPLHDAVKELVTRMRDGKFLFSSVGEMPVGASGEKRRFHCKFYIADDAVSWSGSANFSRNGLVRSGNDEQLVASRNAEEIAYFRRYYEKQLNESCDLLAELQSLLEQWLDLHTPFEAYLKALLCSYSPDRYPVDKPANEPTYFQEGVIVRAVEQVQKYGGALLLVATGLGKTVIGAEIARRILMNHSRNSINRLVVIAPRVTEKQWHDELKGRGCYKPEFFDNSTLFKAASEDNTGQASQLENCVELCNASTVFLIDEAHRYRNLLLKDAKKKRENKKLTNKERKEEDEVTDRVDRIAKQGGKIILLTATPYGTQKQNINSLLRMLPPKSPPTRKPPRHLFEQEEGTENARPTASHWSVAHIDKTAQREVVIVLGMLHVLQMARDRGDSEPDGRLFIAMRDGSKKYLPRQIRLHRVAYPVFLQEQMEGAYSARVFDAQVISYSRWNEEKSDVEPGAANSWENNTLRAWLSSPRELKRVLQICYNAPDPAPNSETESQMKIAYDLAEPESEPSEMTAYTTHCDVKFTQTQAKRQRVLKAILETIEADDVTQDSKIAILINLLEAHRSKGEKAIIFVRRHATAIYLEEKLTEWLEQLRCGCTITYQENGETYKLKSNRQRLRLIRNFAPEANMRKGGRLPAEQDQLDVLICTDADGIGQNLQDATVVINYDLPLTADELFQRAGRVLRPTPGCDREIDTYTFVPDVTNSHTDASVAINNVVNSLFERQNQANDIIDCGRILPSTTDPNPVIMSLASASDLDNIPTRYRPIEDELQQGPNSASRHISNFEKYEVQTSQVKDKIIVSAKKAAVRQPSVCVFIEGRYGIEPVLFNLKKNQIEARSREEILDLLECPNDTDKDTVSAKVVEAAALKAFDAWLEQKSEDERLFPYERVCTVYLRPEDSQQPEQALARMLNEN